MHLVPALGHKRADGADAGNEPIEIAIENGELGEECEQPQIAGLLQERLGGLELRLEIDRGAIERTLVAVLILDEIRRGQEPLGARHEIHVAGVEREIEVGAAGIVIRDGADQRVVIDVGHVRACGWISSGATLSI